MIKSKICEICGTIFTNERKGGGCLGDTQFIPKSTCSLKCSGIRQRGKNKPLHTEKRKKEASKRMKRQYALGIRRIVFTPEVRMKMSESRKLAYKEGRAVSWNKGLPMEESLKEKLRKINTGRKMPDEQKRRFSEIRKKEWASGERKGGWKINANAGLMVIAEKRRRQKRLNVEMREKLKQEQKLLKEKERELFESLRPVCGKCGIIIRKHNETGMCRYHRIFSTLAKEKAKAKYHANLDESRRKARELTRKYRGKKQTYDIEYRKRNAKKIDTRVYQWRLDRFKRDPLFKFKERLKCRMYVAFKKIGMRKPQRSMELLGGSLEEIRKHIEARFTEGMMWNNYGKWHVDHVIPLVSGKTQEEMIKLCHYKNLQPLWAVDNLRKGAKMV